MADERPIILAQHADQPGLPAIETPQATVPGEAHAAVEAQPPGGEHHGAFPPFDPSTFGAQLLWLVIAFGLLYAVLSRVILPKLGGLLEERAGRISDDLAEAERLRTETDAAVARYEQSLQQARMNASSIGAKARDAAKAEADAERRTLEQGLSERMTTAETEIRAVKTRALGEVDAIATDVAEALVAALGGPSVDRATLATAVAEKSEGGAR